MYKTYKKKKKNLHQIKKVFWCWHRFYRSLALTSVPAQNSIGLYWFKCFYLGSGLSKTLSNRPTAQFFQTYNYLLVFWPLYFILRSTVLDRNIASKLCWSKELSFFQPILTLSQFDYVSRFNWLFIICWKPPRADLIDLPISRKVCHRPI